MEKNNKKTVIIVGAGIGGLALSAMLGKKGYEVELIEKNSQVGGRARSYSKNGYTFDMGPSWYMMPDVFEHYFSLMDEKISDLYTLERLSPSYKVFLEGDKSSSTSSYLFYSETEKNKKIFEDIEVGAGKKLEKFLKDTKEQYEISYNEFMFKNYDSFFDFINLRVMKVGARLPLFKSQEKIINNIFKSEVLQKVMQYQTVLLGTAPKDTPGIYSLMNYVDMVLGEWYPKNGIKIIPETLLKLAKKHNVKISNNMEVDKIIIENNIATGVLLKNGETKKADIIISNADITHTDVNLLPMEYRIKEDKYWDKATMAPSAFMMYLGVNQKIEGIEHHNLIFSKDWKKNFSQIFDNPTWPEEPSIYICAPSKTDKNVAPENKENLFILVPIASGLEDTEKIRKEYKDKVIKILEKYFKIDNLEEKLEVCDTYCVNDFIKDYNSFKGTALGLAHTLKQTAFFRPNNIHPKVPNLYFVGAGTNPGIGMPICLISAELVYKRIESIDSPHPLTSL